MSEIQKMENVYIIVDKNGVGLLATVAFNEEVSKFLFAENLTFHMKYSEKKGYRCIKVNIQFEEVK